MSCGHLADYNLLQNKVRPTDVVIYMTWIAMVILYIIQRRRDNLMGGLEVHEHQLFPIFSDGSHPVGVHANLVRTCQEVLSKSREMMYGDPLHTCKEVSANGGRIEVEGHHVRLRIKVSQSKTR